MFDGKEIPMDAKKSLVNAANRITAKYCRGYIPAKQIQSMYSELNAIGISVGLIHGDSQDSPKTTNWEVNGNEVENSLFVYSHHKSENTSNIEFTCYFS